MKELEFKVYATEISPEIITELKKEYKNIIFKVSDNTKINFKKNYFNYVLCNHSIYYLASGQHKFRDTINEIKRVTKVGV